MTDNTTEHHIKLYQSCHFDETVEIWCPSRDEVKVIIGRYYVEYCPICGSHIAGWYDE